MNSDLIRIFGGLVVVSMVVGLGVYFLLGPDPSIEEISNNPKKFDGQTLTVSGTIEVESVGYLRDSYEAKLTKNGNSINIGNCPPAEFAANLPTEVKAEITGRWVYGEERSFLECQESEITNKKEIEEAADTSMEELLGPNWESKVLEEASRR